MIYESGKHVWNNICKCKDSYSVSELTTIKNDIENIVIPRTKEKVVVTVMICTLLAGIIIAGCTLPMHSLNAAFYIIFGLNVGLGITYFVLYVDRTHKLDSISTMAFQIKNIIGEKRIEIHKKSVVIQSSINTWTLHLNGHNVPKEKIQVFLNYLSQNIKAEQIPDPTLILSNECVFLKLAARHADISIDIFNTKTKTPLHNYKKATAAVA